VFLKRTKVDNLSQKDFFLGNTINVFARQMKLVDYADLRTREACQPTTQKTFAMIKPDCFGKAGKIVAMIEAAGLSIVSLRMHQMSLEEAAEFYAEHKGKPFYDGLVQFICSGTVLGMELMGINAVAAWRNLLGPTNCATARSTQPDSVRAKFGTEGVRNAAHGSDAVSSAEREIALFFKKFEKNRDCFKAPIITQVSKENRSFPVNNVLTGVSGGKTMVPPTTNTLIRTGGPKASNFACLIIKPHLLKSGKAGEALQAILDRVKDQPMAVTGIELFSLNKDEVEELMEVYKGVLPEYGLMVEEMKAGPLIAMLVQGEGMVVPTLRKICGPYDPQLARALRGDTLRSIFGTDKARNGIHCTDLEEDGPLECEFFFSVIQRTV
jgi:nucleoside-diphosphate kinase